PHRCSPNAPEPAPTRQRRRQALEPHPAATSTEPRPRQPTGYPDTGHRSNGAREHAPHRASGRVHWSRPTPRWPDRNSVWYVPGCESTVVPDPKSSPGRSRSALLPHAAVRERPAAYFRYHDPTRHPARGTSRRTRCRVPAPWHPRHSHRTTPRPGRRRNGCRHHGDRSVPDRRRAGSQPRAIAVRSHPAARALRRHAAVAAARTVVATCHEHARPRHRTNHGRRSSSGRLTAPGHLVSVLDPRNSPTEPCVLTRSCTHRSLVRASLQLGTQFRRQLLTDTIDQQRHFVNHQTDIAVRRTE